MTPILNLLTINRSVHRWGALIIAAPLLLVIVTGILLQVKELAPWLQPPAMRGSTDSPTMAFHDILAAAKKIPEAEIRDWSDIQRFDVWPSRGLIKVRAKNGIEVQLDAAHGAVLNVAYRRSYILVGLHSGAIFHPIVKYGIYLSTAIILLFLWLSGLVLFFSRHLIKINGFLKKRSQDRVT
jgi:uncharacterized iron-regulated membrane protein